MRILQLTSHLNIGGVARYVLTLSEELRSRGHAVTIASGGGELAAQAEGFGIAHWHLPLHTKAEFSPPVFRAVRELTARLRREPVDMIHAHTRVGQVAADRLSKRLAIPYVATWHGFFRPNFGRWLWPCTGDLTIAISGPVRQHLQDDFHVPASRIRLVYNGVDPARFATAPDTQALERFRAQWRIQPGRRTIGAVGRFASGRVKGFDLLLAAAAQLSQQVSDLQVILVGDGPRRPFLEEKARHFGIRDHVFFVGTTLDTRVPMALMDVFVFSSRWPEGFGLALIEAMAAGKPVVATPVGAVPEIIVHDDCGWLVPPEDPQALADALAMLLRDPATSLRLGTRAQARIRERFSLRRMVDGVEAVYRELLGARAGSAQPVGGSS